MISAVLLLIVARHKRLQDERAAALASGVAEADLPRLPNLVVWNTHFWSKLTEDARDNDPARPGCKVVVESGYCYANVTRWTRERKADGRPGVDVSGADVILVPINHGNTHWALAVMWPQRRQVVYWDSLGGGAYRDHVCSTLIRWYADEVHAKRRRCTPWPGGVAPLGAERIPPSSAHGAATAVAHVGSAASCSGSQPAASSSAGGADSGGGTAAVGGPGAASTPATASTSGSAAATAAKPQGPAADGPLLSKHELAAQWRIMDAPPDLPQQDNGIDCGVFLLGFADWVSLGLEAELGAGAFGMAHINDMRAAYAAAILQHQLLPLTLERGRSEDELPDLPPMDRAAARAEEGSGRASGKPVVGAKRRGAPC